MDRRSFLRRATASGAACLCGTCTGLTPRLALASEGAPHWAYEGHGGPEEWGSLAPEYAACSIGKEQSPIDLTRAIPAAVADPKLDWKAQPLKVLNNGHTIQVDCAGGGQMVVDDTVYSLLQFHFHHPSEHTIDGAPFDMECHFVHKAADGGLAVLGVMIATGAFNPALEAVFKIMPAEGGKTVTGPAQFDPNTLLPKSWVSFRYAGSLTTPPCSEVVQWVVLRTPISASSEQIARFTKLFANNARPVQPLNRRKLLLDVL